MLRTSQSGRIADRGGRIRPVMAPSAVSGRPGHAREHADRVADAAPGHRRRVGDQAERRRLERVEPQPDQERARDRHRRTAAAGPLEEGAEAEGDQDQLQPLVRRERRDRLLHHLELPRLDGDLVEEDRRDDDPGDPQEPELDPQRRTPRRPAVAGMPKTTRASTTATTIPASAATQTRALSASRTKNSVSTGRAATSVESGQECSGS